MKPLSPLPSGPPFSDPPGVTYEGGPFPQQFPGPNGDDTEGAPLFSFSTDAQSLLGSYESACKLQGLTVISLSLVDGRKNGQYPQFEGPDDPSIYIIKGTLQDADLVTYDLEDVAGELFKRKYIPNPEQRDTNYTQVGHGEDADDVAYPGPLQLVITLLPESGDAEGHWEIAKPQ